MLLGKQNLILKQWHSLKQQLLQAYITYYVLTVNSTSTMCCCLYNNKKKTGNTEMKLITQKFATNVTAVKDSLGTLPSVVMCFNMNCNLLYVQEIKKVCINKKEYFCVHSVFLLVLF